MAKIIGTSKALVKLITSVEMYYPISTQLATVVWLALPFVYNDYSIPEGSLYSSKKLLEQHGLMKPGTVNKSSGFKSYAFGLGTLGAPTTQKPWHANWESSCKSTLGFDYSLVNAANLKQKNIELRNLLQNKELKFNISIWQMPAGSHFYGPDGNSLQIL